MNTEINKDLKLREIRSNYEYFKQILPTIIHEHRGAFALIKNKKIVQFYSTAIDAEKAGYQCYSDGIFSVQKVDDVLIDLGMFAYA